MFLIGSLQPLSNPVVSKSVLSHHQVKTGHVVISKPVIEGVRLIDNETRNTYRNVKEAIHIELQGATLNRTGGYNLPERYLPLLIEEKIRGAGRG